ncbi:BufA2 family periplasmic bufferin-type metallophore [Ostreibacterium oceani]|uniref:Lipoprotein n=1 Tax=Ostreibacterium oceani TaxID=2654998 RepID=A0A6N7EU17_9GAMM|nr:hypothetical protein [Ostreibacterium oceani]MPV85922.1 hypothetical protein [Ostreibacterium oceani]
MGLKTKGTGIALAVSASMLIAGCASNQQQADASSHGSADGMVQCHGVNSCKGTSSCKAEGSSCAGKNACKGKGWLPMSQSECESHGGRMGGFNMN